MTIGLFLLWQDYAEMELIVWFFIYNRDDRFFQFIVPLSIDIRTNTTNEHVYANSIVTQNPNYPPYLLLSELRTGGNELLLTLKFSNKDCIVKLDLYNIINKHRMHFVMGMQNT